jgi:hypothetical protein
MPRWIVLLILLYLPVFAAPVAQASAREHAHDGNELRKAEAVLSKLRRLEAAAASAHPGDFGKAARGLYPGLFEAVSELREGDLKTDLSTAVTLYESALRAGDENSDCARELRETYARLCVEARGDRARLLRAKARLHAGWAEAGLLYARGVRDPAAHDFLSLIRAERATDRALAEEALLELKELAAAFGGGGRDEAPAETFSGRLEQLERLLASLPRDRTARLLREARDAFRDGLYWRLKARPARSLVVDVNSFDAAHPGALPRLGLRADDADGAADANLRAALKFVDRAEEALRTIEALGTTNAGRRMSD